MSEGKVSERKQMEAVQKASKGYGIKIQRNGILLPKLFWPTVRKSCSSDWKKKLKFEAEGQEIPKFLRSLEQFIQTVKSQNAFSTCF